MKRLRVLDEEQVVEEEAREVREGEVKGEGKCHPSDGFMIYSNVHRFGLAT